MLEAMHTKYPSYTPLISEACALKNLTSNTLQWATTITLGLQGSLVYGGKGSTSKALDDITKAEKLMSESVELLKDSPIAKAAVVGTCVLYYCS
jgi:hypothetical protein